MYFLGVGVCGDGGEEVHGQLLALRDVFGLKDGPPRAASSRPFVRRQKCAHHRNSNPPRVPTRTRTIHVIYNIIDMDARATSEGETAPHTDTVHNRAVFLATLVYGCFSCFRGPPGRLDPFYVRLENRFRNDDGRGPPVNASGTKWL